jgi:aspartyl-tRNA(Asn)/glutamyl-tRNA(Gln) amidotransferase subunit B
VRGVAGAVKYEIERQIQIKESGGVVENETRAWDASRKITVAMRDKEQQQDYRYMPEPNLPPLHVAMGPVGHGCVNADELRQTMPELPEQTRCRLRDSHGLTLEQSVILVGDAVMLQLFEGASWNRNLDGKLLANLLINDFLTTLHKMNLDPTQQ